MASWAEFEAAVPEMAADGKKLIYQFGIGLEFLATIRKDGGPRLHPICPIVTDGGLYAFIVPSPKMHDLRRDGRIAFHSFPPAESADSEDEFYITGTAHEVTDPDERARADAAFEVEVKDEHALFSFDIEHCLLAKYRFRGDFPPAYSRWHAPEHQRADG